MKTQTACTHLGGTALCALGARGILRRFHDFRLRDCRGRVRHFGVSVQASMFQKHASRGQKDSQIQPSRLGGAVILLQAIHLWELLGTAFYTYFILNDVRTVPKTFYATPADLKKCGGQALQAFVRGLRVPGPFRV